MSDGPDDNIIDIGNYKVRGRKEEEADVIAEVTPMVLREAIAFDGQIIGADDAFRVYAAVDKGGRSLRKTAKLLGIPEGTVLSWSSRHGWRQKMLDLDREVVEGVLEAGAVALMAQSLKNIQRLSGIVDDPASNPMAVIFAAKEMNRMQEKIVGAMISRMVVSTAGDDLDDDELEKLASSKEGVAKLLQLQRERTGHA